MPRFCAPRSGSPWLTSTTRPRGTPRRGRRQRAIERLACAVAQLGLELITHACTAANAYAPRIGGEVGAYSTACSSCSAARCACGCPRTGASRRARAGRARPRADRSAASPRRRASTAPSRCRARAARPSARISASVQSVLCAQIWKPSATLISRAAIRSPVGVRRSVDDDDVIDLERRGRARADRSSASSAT